MAQPLASLDGSLTFDASSRFARNRHFWETLKRYCGKAKFARQKTGKTRVLDLCCGTAEEASVLCAYFSSGTPDLPTDQVVFYGIDRDPAVIARAEENFSLASMGTMPITVMPTGRFLSADATALTAIKDLPEHFDFILVRHQFVASDKENGTHIWPQIFREALQKLSPQGLMLITSFSEIEHLWCKEALQTLPGKMVFAEENPEQITLGHKDSIAGDKFVIGVKSGLKPLP